jgi:type II secretory pathway component PulC
MYHVGGGGTPLYMMLSDSVYAWWVAASKYPAHYDHSKLRHATQVEFTPVPADDSDSIERMEGIMKQAKQLGISLSILLVFIVASSGYPERSESAGMSAENTQQTAPPLGGLVAELPGYKLIGIIAGSPEDARAVFEEVSTKRQKLYLVGEAIAGATLVEIKRHQVVLKSGKELIVVQISAGTPRERAPGDPIPVPFGSEDPQQALQQVLAQQMDPTDPRAEKKAVSRPELNRLFQFLHRQVKDNVFVTTSLGSAIDLNRMDRETLTNLGLEPSDLIVGISGLGIDSQERLNQIIEILKRAKVFNLSVLRGRVVQPLFYAIQPGT